ncbi:hypothetical protein VPH35_120525 [Triticum aestivum]
MRRFFYHKVVLSDSADIAMLITNLRYGAMAFATAKGRVWRLVLSHHSIAKVRTKCDALHHEGRFYSITYFGEVEAWEQDSEGTGVFTSVVVAPGQSCLGPAASTTPADDLSLYYLDNQHGAGLFSLKDSREEKVEGLGSHRNKPPPAWFTLSIP